MKSVLQIEVECGNAGFHVGLSTKSILAATMSYCAGTLEAPVGTIRDAADDWWRRGVAGNFPARVYAVVRMIPEGKVTTYGRVSRALGAARSARMVGWALNYLPADSDVPAHRVVNRNGQLTGAHHFGPPDVMRNLLEDEGVTFVDEITVDLREHLWDPAEDSRIDDLFQIPD